MAVSAAGLALAAGGLTAANEVLFAPAAGTGKPDFQWRIVPATLFLAMAFAAIESAGPEAATIARGLGWIMVTTVVLAPVGNAKSPVENIGAIVGK